MSGYLPAHGGSEQRLRILVIEDDDPTRNALARGLRLYGHEVAAAPDAEFARRALARQRFEVLLLDVNLPGASGYDLLRDVRSMSADTEGTKPDVAVLMLSGRGEEQDRVRGFELGCDDYVVKPYSFPELRGRLAALMRRGGGREREVQRLGELVIFHRERRVELAGRAVALTAKEWALLTELASDPARVFKREHLLDRIWGYPGGTRTLDAHACRLRRKLDGGSRRYVVNTWGVGYRLFDRDPAGEWEGA